MVRINSQLMLSLPSFEGIGQNLAHVDFGLGCLGNNGCARPGTWRKRPWNHRYKVRSAESKRRFRLDFIRQCFQIGCSTERHDSLTLRDVADRGAGHALIHGRHPGRQRQLVGMARLDQKKLLLERRQGAAGAASEKCSQENQGSHDQSPLYQWSEPTAVRILDDKSQRMEL